MVSEYTLAGDLSQLIRKHGTSVPAVYPSAVHKNVQTDQLFPDPVFYMYKNCGRCSEYPILTLTAVNSQEIKYFLENSEKGS